MGKKRWGLISTFYEVLYFPEGIGVGKPWQYLSYDWEPEEGPPRFGTFAQASEYRNDWLLQGKFDPGKIAIVKVVQEIL